MSSWAIGYVMGIAVGLVAGLIAGRKKPSKKNEKKVKVLLGIGILLGFIGFIIFYLKNQGTI